MPLQALVCGKGAKNNLITPLLHNLAIRANLTSVFHDSLLSYLANCYSRLLPLCALPNCAVSMTMPFSSVAFESLLSGTLRRSNLPKPGPLKAESCLRSVAPAHVARKLLRPNLDSIRLLRWCLAAFVDATRAQICLRWPRGNASAMIATGVNLTVETGMFRSDCLCWMYQLSFPQTYWSWQSVSCASQPRP